MHFEFSGLSFKIINKSVKTTTQTQRGMFEILIRTMVCSVWIPNMQFFLERSIRTATSDVSVGKLDKFNR